MYYVPIQPKEFVLQFASFLLKSNSLRFGVFTLASGKQSAYRPESEHELDPQQKEFKPV